MRGIIVIVHGNVTIQEGESVFLQQGVVNNRKPFVILIVMNVIDKGALTVMQKWVMLVFFSIACLFNMPKPPVEETAPEGVQLVNIVANADFTFDKAEYEVKVGEPVLLKLKNKSGIHGAAIEELGIDLKDGQMEKQITFDKPGTYQIHCSVMCGAGHTDMISVLVVK